MARSNKWYGWIPDLPDQRDFVYTAPVRVVKKLPPKADLRKHCPPVYDQGVLGSCTANAVGAAHQFDQMRQAEAGMVDGSRLMVGNRSAHISRSSVVSPQPAAHSSFTPSRLFIYYNERVMMDTVDEDSGAMLRDGIKTIAKQGVCPETDSAAEPAARCGASWPYVIAKFRTRPGKACYTHALKHQALTYYSVRRTLGQMKGCLASGFPFVFGFSVYESFEAAAVARTGVVPMPRPKESLIGGHAVMAVGYDDARRRFMVRNSWGARWGMKGYFTMPYEYLLDKNLTADFWTVRLVEQP